ncbi:MAG: DUF1343 domain-containing protein [Phycisphaerales bacterium]|nr:MAG: DUF1343 domain-containing protein [Phycisphaerales bacterium]
MMRFFEAVWLLVTALCVSVCGAAVRTGLDGVDVHRGLFAGKRIGIIANHTARDVQGRHIVDVFQAMDDVTVTALFSPEHGLYGTEGAGDTVDSMTDPIYGLSVRSLYGQTRKPTAEMLRDVDVLVFDIQDIGARFYTYISTMSLAMEAAAECGKRFVVLDRPNPITGLHVEGPVLESEFSSFVGLHPIPVRHGMTVGELARMFNGRRWLADGVQAELAVVPMQGWQRGLWFDQTGLAFIKPSPNIPDVATATVYPGLCLFEGTNLSEGRGTPRPFLQFGAPWLDPETLARRLNSLNLSGLRFAPMSFTPSASKHQGTECHGVRLTVTDREKLDAFWSGVAIVNEVHRLDPTHFEWRASHFDRLCGTAAIRAAIVAGESLVTLRDRCAAECRGFEKARQAYLLYR